MKGKVLAINVSKEKGVPKTTVDEAVFIEEYGIEGDAHAGKWHRQVSLLGDESVEKMRAQGAQGLCTGKFAENITTQGLDLWTLPVGTLVKIGETLQEVTQIGKECHAGCSIRALVGDCVMPREGIFTRVVKGGIVRTGDTIEVVEGRKVGIIVASDKGSKGERVDMSGKKIEELMTQAGYAVLPPMIVPDEQEALQEAMLKLANERKCSLILTTGGTGFAKRDVTPEATKAVIEKECPGIPELMRFESMKKTNRAMLSRAAAGIVGDTLIVNMPGSPRAVEECLTVILDPLAHGLDILLGSASECARP